MRPYNDDASENSRKKREEKEITKENIDNNLENIKDTLIHTLNNSTISMNNLISRGMSLSELEDKSNTLCNDTKHFRKNTEWYNASIFWKAIHYVNIFRMCSKDCW